MIGICLFSKNIKILPSHKEVVALIDHSPYSSSFMKNIREYSRAFFITTQCLDKENEKFRSNSEGVPLNTHYQSSLTLKQANTCFTLNAIQSPNISGAGFGPEVVNQFEHFDYKLSRSYIGRLEQILVSLDKVYELSLSIYTLVLLFHSTFFFNDHFNYVKQSRFNLSSCSPNITQTAISNHTI